MDIFKNPLVKAMLIEKPKKAPANPMARFISATHYEPRLAKIIGEFAIDSIIYVTAPSTSFLLISDSVWTMQFQT